MTLSDPKGIYTFARNIGGNVINVGFGRRDKLRISKRIIKSLPHGQRNCYETLYYGKKSCIEDQATKLFTKRMGCILPWMTLLQPNFNICFDQNKAFNEALEEYMCAMKEITQTSYSYSAQWTALLY